MISGLSQLSYQQRLETLHLPTLKYRRYRGDMIELFKLSRGYYDELATLGFIEFRSDETVERRLRQHSFHMKKEPYKRDIWKYALRCRVADQWDHLPKSIAEATSLNIFKNKLDNLWKREGMMYNPNIDIQSEMSRRNIRYMLVEEVNPIIEED